MCYPVYGMVHIKESLLLTTYSTSRLVIVSHKLQGVRCSYVVRAFAHGATGRRIDPSWGGPIRLFLIPVSAANRKGPSPYV